MGLKATIAKYYAAYLLRKRNKWTAHPKVTQRKVLQNLIEKASGTAFGIDHSFSEIKDYESFKNRVPVADYEDLRPYINRVVEGERDVLWPGLPAYIAKTSGTTS